MSMESTSHATATISRECEYSLEEVQPMDLPSREPTSLVLASTSPGQWIGSVHEARKRSVTRHSSSRLSSFTLMKEEGESQAFW